MKLYVSIGCGEYVFRAEECAKQGAGRLDVGGAPVLSLPGRNSTHAPTVLGNQAADRPLRARRLSVGLGKNELPDACMAESFGEKVSSVLALQPR